jgi:hypothetical protein
MPAATKKRLGGPVFLVRPAAQLCGGRADRRYTQRREDRSPIVALRYASRLFVGLLRPNHRSLPGAAGRGGYAATT